MNRTRLLLLILILIVIGVGAAAFILTQQPQDPPGPTPEFTEELVDEDVGDEDVTLGPPTPTITPIPRTEVVVAVQNIPRGNRIDPNMVGVIEFPAESVALGAFSDVEEVIGKIARTDIFREQHILSNMVVNDLTGLSTGTGSDIAAVLPQNLVAISVPVDRITSVGYALQPGDRVDVIVSMLFVDVDPDFQSILPNYDYYVYRGYEVGGDSNRNEPIEIVSPPARGDVDTRAFQGSNLIVPIVSEDGGVSEITIRLPPDTVETFYRTPFEEQRPRLATQITVRNALVMWVGDFPLDGVIFRPAPTPTPVGEVSLEPTPTEVSGFVPPTPTGQSASPTPTEDLPDLVTLAVTPQDAIVLTYFIEARLPITFALRSASTVALQETEPVTLRFILERYNIRVPDKLNFAVEPAIRSIRELSAGNRIELQAPVTPTTPPEEGGDAEGGDDAENGTNN